MVNVILIDDSKDFIISAKKLLEEEGIKVIDFALSGKEGIEKVKTLNPDLVFVDIVMPGLDGFSVIREIKKINDSIKTVILTLYDNEEYKKAGDEAGADGFVSKSEFFSGVKETINKILEEKGMKTVLVVDDSKTIRKMVITSLSKIPSLVFEEAESGLFALEKLAIKKIDLMILDLNMPDMHGLEVLKFVRGHDNFKNLPVIILTTRGDEEMREKALKEGANYYMTKPFNPEELISRVKEFLI